MPKKSSRRSSRSTPSTVMPAQSPSTKTSSRTREAPASPDYSYVVSDLKRIGILAGAFILGMIILYFVLPYILPLYAH